MAASDPKRTWAAPLFAASRYRRIHREISIVINKADNPVGWALFLYELDDAREHLAKLIEELGEDASYDEASLRVDLGHVYAHLNRAWRRRLAAEDLSDLEWHSSSAFPDDLEPIA
jgi:hypothetical protein